MDVCGVTVVILWQAEHLWFAQWLFNFAVILLVLLTLA